MLIQNLYLLIGDPQLFLEFLIELDALVVPLDLFTGIVDQLDVHE